jgi:hypothetical protein
VEKKRRKQNKNHLISFRVEKMLRAIIMQSKTISSVMERARSLPCNEGSKNIM